MDMSNLIEIDPEKMSSVPVFLGRVYRSRICLIVLKLATAWIVSLSSFRP